MRRPRARAIALALITATLSLAAALAPSNPARAAGRLVHRSVLRQPRDPRRARVNGSWSLVPSPDPGSGDNGIAAPAAVPGGGVWGVGVTAKSGNYSTLIEHVC